MESKESNDKSTAKLLEELVKNDSLAQHKAWEQFANKIEKLAQKNLTGLKRRSADEEDITVKVLNSLFQRLADGRLSKPTSDGELWNLLISMIRNKSSEEIRSSRAEKRGKGLVRGESAFEEFHHNGHSGIDNAVECHDDPKVAFEEAQRLTDMLESLGDKKLRQIAMLKLAGHTIEEIAEILDSGVRTIQRRLHQMRNIIDRQSH